MVSCISTVLLILSLSLHWPWHCRFTNQETREFGSNLQLYKASPRVLMFSSVSHLSRPGSCEESQVAYRGEASGWCPSTFRVLSGQKVHRFSPVGLLSRPISFVVDLTDIVHDLLCGKIVLETNPKIPWKVKLLGIFKKYSVAISDCEITLGFPSMKVQNQECEWAPSSELF